jgi:hypothetical protein
MKKPKIFESHPSWFVVNPILYGKIACIHCKQDSICCPALNFFTKEKGN